MQVVEKLVEEIPELLQGAEVKDICPMLKQLVVNAEKNALKLPQQRWHELVLKTFATSLYILLVLWPTILYIVTYPKPFLLSELYKELYQMTTNHFTKVFSDLENFCHI